MKLLNIKKLFSRKNLLLLLVGILIVIMIFFYWDLIELKKNTYHKKTYISNLSKTGDVLIPYAVEASPIVFHHRLIVLYAPRRSAFSNKLYIIDYFTKKVIAVTDCRGLGFGSVYVEKNRLFYFGTDWKNRKVVKMMYTDDLKHWSKPIIILQAKKGQYIFNTSVAKDNTGYIMTYETSDHNPHHIDFSEYFSHSKDLKHWNPIGTIFQPKSYAACPTIRYHNGYYYMFYLAIKSLNPEGHWTKVARSKDLIHWEYSSKIALQPTFPDELTNASDIDFIQYHQAVYFVYAVGNQNNQMDVKTAYFDGLLKDYLQSFFEKVKR